MSDERAEDPLYTVGNVYPANSEKLPTGSSSRKEAAEADVFGTLIEEGPGWDIRMPEGSDSPVLRKAPPSYQLTNEAYQRFGWWQHSFDKSRAGDVNTAARQAMGEAHQDRGEAEMHKSRLVSDTASRLSQIKSAARVHRLELCEANARLALRITEILDEDFDQ